MSKGKRKKKKRTNQARIARRARSWARGQVRKAERIAANDAREAANRVRRAKGEPTPWELTLAKIKARRVEAKRRRAA